MGCFLALCLSKVNLTGAKYQDFLVEQVFPTLMEHFGYQFDDNKFMHLWWAQDGAPAHRFNPICLATA